MCVVFEHNTLYMLKLLWKYMDEEELDEFIYEFHERVLEIEPEQNERPEWDWIRRK